MKTVLKGMVGKGIASDFDLHYSEYEKAKAASLTGVGEVGVSPMIYTAHIWVGPNSLFTLEGELIGHGDEKADNLFAQILSSIQIPEIAESDAKEESQETENEETNGDKAPPE